MPQEFPRGVGPAVDRVLSPGVPVADGHRQAIWVSFVLGFTMDLAIKHLGLSWVFTHPNWMEASPKKWGQFTQ